MVRINEGLEEFYFRLDETDQWLDSAIEHTQDLQASHSSLEEQLVVFKVTLLLLVSQISVLKVTPSFVSVACLSVGPRSFIVTFFKFYLAEEN